METSQYRTLIAGGVLLALVGATVYVMQSETGDSGGEEVELPTLPELEREAIEQITITRPAGEDEEAEAPIVLARVDDTWRVTSPVESPTAESAVNAVLDKLTDLEVAGIATRNASFHERLEVAEANGVRVQVVAGGEEVLDFRLGAYRSSTTMLRLEGEDAVLQMQGSIKFAFNKPLRDWRDRTVTDLSVNELTAISFENENGTFRFRRQAEEGEEAEEGAEEEEASTPDPWVQVLEPLEEGGEALAAIEELAPARVQSLATSAARVRASSFGDGLTEAETGLGEGASVITMTEGDTTVVLRVGNEADEERHERYARVEGNDTIFVLSRFLSERLLPDAEAFVAPEAGEEEEAAPAPPPSPLGAGGPPGGGQIPPEVMRQIQQQLQQQGGGGGHAGHRH